MNSTPPITIQQLLQQAQQKISPLDAELLIAHILKKPREWILAHPETEIKNSRLKIIKKLITRRAKGEPLAYLIGHKEFFGLDFEVNKDVLVPRPETETLVSLVLERLSTIDYRLSTTLIDVGTGSGCIPISILKNLHTYTLTHLQTFAIDISKKALVVAKYNARKHKVKIKFLHGDLLSPVIARSEGRATRQSSGQQIIITANLPYLTNKQYKSSPSIHHEPHLALVAKNNGLALYEKLLKQIKKLTTYNLSRREVRDPDFTSGQLTTYTEIDPSQTKQIKLLIKKFLPDAKVEIKKDLSGLNRVVIIKLTY